MRRRDTRRRANPPPRTISALRHGLRAWGTRSRCKLRQERVHKSSPTFSPPYACVTQCDQLPGSRRPPLSLPSLPRSSPLQTSSRNAGNAHARIEESLGTRAPASGHALASEGATPHPPPLPARTLRTTPVPPLPTVRYGKRAQCTRGQKRGAGKPALPCKHLAERLENTRKAARQGTKRGETRRSEASDKEERGERRGGARRVTRRGEASDEDWQGEPREGREGARDGMPVAPLYARAAERTSPSHKPSVLRA
ncbi:hypothetical protein K525DRAFT_275132 [Schizophyllum commune Loenen D]|nr:hypothetical protein K525DRAFT_275132 [Schizophyllum commune Loenen D]